MNATPGCPETHGHKEPPSAGSSSPLTERRRGSLAIRSPPGSRWSQRSALAASSRTCRTYSARLVPACSAARRTAWSSSTGSRTRSNGDSPACESEGRPRPRTYPRATSTAASRRPAHRHPRCNGFLSSSLTALPQRRRHHVNDDDRVRQIEGHDLQLDPAVVEAEPVHAGGSLTAAIQDLHRVHGLTVISAARLPLFPPSRAGPPTTLQTTLGFDPDRFKTEPPVCYRASWAATGPDSHRQATTSTNSKITSRGHPLFHWAHEDQG